MLSFIALGWDMGVNGMKVGEERKLVIPPSVRPALLSARTSVA